MADHTTRTHERSVKIQATCWDVTVGGRWAGKVTRQSRTRWVASVPPSGKGSCYGGFFMLCDTKAEAVEFLRRRINCGL